MGKLIRLEVRGGLLQCNKKGVWRYGGRVTRAKNEKCLKSPWWARDSICAMYEKGSCYVVSAFWTYESP